MTEQITAACREQQRKKIVARTVEFGLPILAVIAVCYISSRETAIPIENAVILAVASLLILVPLKSELLNVLQKIIGFYLLSVPVNESSSQYFQIPFLPVKTGVSFSTLVLSMCAIGYIIGRVNPADALQDSEKKNILHGWILVTVLIITHMIILSLMLNRFYGYGYERNMDVLGNLCLYLLLFTVLWEKLSNLRFRQAIGLVLSGFYLAVIIAKR